MVRNLMEGALSDVGGIFGELKASQAMNRRNSNKGTASGKAGTEADGLQGGEIINRSIGR